MTLSKNFLTSKFISAGIISAGLLLTAPANAAVVSVLPGDANWGSTGNSGGGSSAITGTTPHSGLGSLELTGDRTRFIGLGNPWDPASNLGLLSSVSDFSFDWMIAGDSISALDPDYTPALRLHIWDGAQRSELIWEGAYNGTYGSTATDTWYTTGNGDNFWRWETGVGVTLNAGAQVNISIDGWVASYYSSDAFVAAISVGVGSSAGGGYHAFSDNVTLGLVGAASTTYNFEVDRKPVPEPSVLMLMGFGLLAGSLVRRRRRI